MQPSVDAQTSTNNSVKSRQHILMVSDQDVLRAGNQILYQTIRGYVKGGFHVSFITNQKHDSNVSTVKELFGADADFVDIIRFPIAFHSIRQKLIGSGWLRRLRKLRSLVKTNDISRESFPPSAEEVIPFAANLSESNLLLDRWAATLFNRYAERVCIKVARARSVDLVYGFEVMAIPVARSVATRLSVPLCTRFQGTFLYHALANNTAKKQYPLHLKGTETESDLCIMSNDGTNGDKVMLRLGHSPQRIKFIFDGVRKDIHEPDIVPASVWSKFGIPTRKTTRTILTLSKLGAWKRQDRIIGALPGILSEVPDAYLVIAHRGEMRNRLERYAQVLGVSDRVVFIGPLPHAEVDSVLNACDVYVNCNDHSNLSHTVMEAMVCGKPVVSIADGSLSDIVTHGDDGILVNLPDIVPDLSTQIIALLKDDVRRAEISRNAQRTAERKLYTWEERMSIEVGWIENLLRARSLCE